MSIGLGQRADRQGPALRLRGLRKTFAARVVDDLDLTVRAGELYALLGPNGAGKTTTLRMVAGLLPPDQLFCCELRSDLPVPMQFSTAAVPWKRP